MLMSTVIAVALGIVPVKQETQLVDGDYTRLVGSYSQSVDPQGTTHLRGFDRQTGRPYDLSVSNDGKVVGKVGDWLVSFQTTNAN
jgi:hypothetical protein